jgi:hypothetical protein
MIDVAKLPGFGGVGKIFGHLRRSRVGGGFAAVVSYIALVAVVTSDLGVCLVNSKSGRGSVSAGELNVI